MKEQKIKRYRRPVSRYFPKGHPKEGQPTYFVEKILKGLHLLGKVTIEDIQKQNIKDFDWHVFETCYPKIHTCRASLKSWIEIIDKVKSGEFILELYYWSDRPYHKDENGIGMVVFATIDKDCGCGVQELLFEECNILAPIASEGHWYKGLTLEELAQNDGLNPDDFKAWFKGYDLIKPMAIIHFTKFRY